MRNQRPIQAASAAMLLLAATGSAPGADLSFTGRIEAGVIRGGETQHLIYIIGTNCVRIQRRETNRPYTVDLVDLKTGGVILLFPNNRSFMRLPSTVSRTPGIRGMPQPPVGIGPEGSVHLPPPADIGTNNLPGGSALPQMPQSRELPTMGAGMPPMPMMSPTVEPPELTATDATTNLLGYRCRLYELKQRGEVMQIWAAATNVPFAQYLQGQPPRFGPRMIQEQWEGLVTAKNLFPLRAELKSENGPERLRYEVNSVQPQKAAEQDPAQFQPPPDYHEL